MEDSGAVIGITILEMQETLKLLFYMARNQNAKIVVEKVRRGV